MAARMTTNLRTLTLFLGLSVLVSSGCSLVGKRTVEEAPYKLVQKDGNFEIREYDSLIVAQTEVSASFKQAGNTAFRKLFDYISGANSADQEIAMTAPVIANPGAGTEGQKIEMTAPVLAQQTGDAWIYQFVLPAGFTLESAPQPTDPDVVIAEVPAKRMAVLRYAGLLGGKKRVLKGQELLNWLDSQQLDTSSSGLQWAGFDPPWTLPPFRRNEVMIELQ